MKEWGSKIEREIHKRIKVSIYAYAYEIDDKSIVSDSEFDKLSYSIDPKIRTGDEFLDDFFCYDTDDIFEPDYVEGEQKQFHPSTGQWIYDHPELWKIKFLYERYYKGMHKRNSRTRYGKLHEELVVEDDDL